MAPKKQDIPEFFVPLGAFDKSRLVQKPAVASTFKKGESDVESCTSEILYLDDDGNECIPIFEFPEGFTYGVNFVTPFGTKKEDICLEIAEGYQICYSLTSRDTIEKPTKNEKYAINILQTLNDVAWDMLVEECSKDEDDVVVPPAAYNSYLGATKGGKENRSYAIKPLLSHPQKEVEVKGKKRKVDDRSKPLRSYFKFLTFGKGEEMSCRTLIYGPGDKKVSPQRYLDKWGNAHPCLILQGIYWGPHGPKSTHGGSVRLRVNDMNFVPQKESAPVKRRLPANLAPAEEFESGDESGDDSFPDPSAKTKKPASSKASASKKSTKQEKDEGFEEADEDESPMDDKPSDDESEGEESEEEETPPPKKSSKTPAKSKAPAKATPAKNTKAAASKAPTKTVADRRKEMLAKRKAKK
jgi:hypothetical protein